MGKRKAESPEKEAKRSKVEEESGDESDGSSLGLPEIIYDDERDFNPDDSDSNLDEDLRMHKKKNKSAKIKKESGNVDLEDSSSDSDDSDEDELSRDKSAPFSMINGVDESSKKTFPLKKDEKKKNNTTTSSSDEEEMIPAKTISPIKTNKDQSRITEAFNDFGESSSSGDEMEVNHSPEKQETPKKSNITPSGMDASPERDDRHPFTEYPILTPAPAKNKTFTSAGTQNDEEYTVYLINKPKSVSMDDLCRLKLPINPEEAKKKLKLKNEEGSWECEMSTSNPQMLHISLDSHSLIAGKGGKRTAAISGRLSGSLSINKKMGVDDIGPLGEDADEYDLPLRPIKRVATRDDWDELHERLTAFGVPSKKRLPGHRSKLPKINI